MASPHLLHVARNASPVTRAAASRAILEDAQAIGVALQRRVQIPVASTAIACMAAGIGLTAATFFVGSFPGSVKVVRQIGYLVMVCGSWLAAAVLLPTDRHLPKLIAACGLVLAAVLTVNDVLTSAKRISTFSSSTGSAFPSAREQCYVLISGLRVFDAPCLVRPRVRLARAVIDASVGFGTLVVLASLLVGQAHPRTCRAYVQAVTRVALLAYTLTDAMQRLADTVSYELFLAARREAGLSAESRYTNVDQLPVLRLAFQLIICAFALSPAGIRRMQAFLARRGSSLVYASAVSALIAGRRAEEVHRHAIATFRGVRADLLQREHFDSFAPSSELFDLSQHMAIGEVDAFVSHSWSDSGAEKFAGLAEWCAHFREKHSGREPVLWLDRACFSQADMESNLAALPAYIMGCRSLLCIVGASYSSRLWCLFECFMFLAAGGKEVTTVTLAAIEAQQQQGRDVWGDVQLRRAQCTFEGDRQRLLATMESAEGDLSAHDLQLQAALRRSVLPSRSAATTSAGRLALGSRMLLSRLPAWRRASYHYQVQVARAEV
jgi:hypothetical protein